MWWPATPRTESGEISETKSTSARKPKHLRVYPKMGQRLSTYLTPVIPSKSES